jgi:hypothetical protein
MLARIRNESTRAAWLGNMRGTIIYGWSSIYPGQWQPGRHYETLLRPDLCDACRRCYLEAESPIADVTQCAMIYISCVHVKFPLGHASAQVSTANSGNIEMPYLGLPFQRRHIRVERRNWHNCYKSNHPRKNHVSKNHSYQSERQLSPSASLAYCKLALHTLALFFASMAPLLISFNALPFRYKLFGR